MTPEQARVGRGVVYRPRPDAPAEDGQIVSMRALGAGLVHVLYRGDETPKSTRLTDLEPAAPDVEQMAANHANRTYGPGYWRDAPAAIRNEIRELVMRARDNDPEEP